MKKELILLAIIGVLLPLGFVLGEKNTLSPRVTVKSIAKQSSRNFLNQCIGKEFIDFLDEAHAGVSYKVSTHADNWEKTSIKKIEDKDLKHIKTILLDDSSYLFDQKNMAFFHPQFAISFSEKNKEKTIYFSFNSKQALFQNGNKGIIDFSLSKEEMTCLLHLIE